MKLHRLPQGSPEWHAHRAQHFNASDAAAMLGCSPYMTRTQLLHAMHTGIRPEVDPGQQLRFDKGHEIEATKRPVAEAIIGEDLYPVVGTEGELSASFDGLTMLQDTNWECKSLNEELRQALPNPGPEGNDAAKLPKCYRVQMEQQCAVSGCTRVLFTASDGQDDDRHCWYSPDPALRAEIIAGWKQFAADLAAYKPPAAAEVVHAAPIEALPAVSVQMQGSLTVHSNLDVFGRMLREFIGKIPAKPSSEQEFADCDAACKALKRAEEALDGAEANALGQVQSVEQITRTIADLRTFARTARLASEKMVKARKEQIRAEEVQRGRSALAEFIAGLNATIGRPYMPIITADFAGVISGKKTVDSVRNAIDTELARAKIAATEVSNTIIVNLRALRELASDHAFLFADVASVVLKPCDDCMTLIKSRIAEHKAAEAKKEAARREEIRQEELARIEREQQAEAARVERERKAAEHNAAGTEAMNNIAEARKAGALPEPVLDRLESVASGLIADLAIGRAANPPTVVPIRPAVDNRPNIRLGQIADKLGFTVTADFLKQLGFEPVATEKAAKLYRAGDEALIYEALVAHIRTVAAKAVQLRASA